MLIEQRSQAWFEARKGKITSSEIHKIMGSGKKEETLTEVAKTYLLEKVAEILGGAPILSHPVGSKPAALEWGTELEPAAVEHYAQQSGLEVAKASFMVVNEHYGGSPDGLVAPSGIIEVKCPYSTANHFKYALIKTDADLKKIAPQYYYQCVSNMICANADWCDFISYDPRVHEDYSMFVYRVFKKQEDVDQIFSRLEVAIEYMRQLQETIQNTVKSKTDKVF